MRKLYVSHKFVSPIGDIFIISSDKGVAHVLIGRGSTPPGCKKGDPFGALPQIDAYFKCTLQNFSLPLDIEVSDFTHKILLETAKIPYGETVSYGELAKAVNKPGSSRAVGGALNRNPVPIIIPCHRVLAKNSLGGFALGAETKAALLSLESVLIK